ncbi:MAG: S41 family peptidase [Alistipes sp.]|nr:S41 family peptidase [Alistipes sp.]
MEQNEKIDQTPQQHSTDADVQQESSSSKSRRWPWFWLSVVIVATLVLSFSTGRIIERNYTKHLVETMSQNMGQYEQGMNDFAAEVAAIEQIISGSDKLMQTLFTIRTSYVDPIELDTLYERVIPAILAELDPHSEYIPARVFDQVNESLEGEFDGIGVVFNAMTDTITVLNVIPRGPSDRAGVRAGDRVIRIDGRDVAGQGLAQDSMVKLMRGPRGSEVTLSVKRGSLNDLVDITVTRAAIEVHSLTAAFMLDKEAGIGYIRLSQFSRTSHDEICNALRRLTVEGMKSLIIDLRGNGGGFLDQAVKIVNEFLNDGELIVYTEDRHGARINEYADGSGRYTQTPIAVLVDEISASSSEILAGAIQDNDRGVIVGRRTFGKGLVQAQLAFNDGSAIRLTVARYYTPSGRSIQRPYVNGDEESYRMDLINRINHHELFSADSIHFDESMKYQTRGGRTVYGGGGIMPDLFVPLDTTRVSDYYEKVWDTNVLYRYTLDYADRNRQKLDAVSTLEQLDSLFDSEDIIADFVAYAEQHGVHTDNQGLALSRDVIETQIRAYIGRNIFGDESGYYYNIYPIDDVMQRAVEQLKKGTLNI